MLCGPRDRGWAQWIRRAPRALPHGGDLPARAARSAAPVMPRRHESADASPGNQAFPRFRPTQATQLTPPAPNPPRPDRWEAVASQHQRRSASRWLELAEPIWSRSPGTSTRVLCKGVLCCRQRRAQGLSCCTGSRSLCRRDGVAAFRTTTSPPAVTPVRCHATGSLARGHKTHRR